MIKKAFKKFSKIPNRLLLIGLLLASLVFAGFFYKNNIESTSSQNLEERVVQILKDCKGKSDTPNALDATCAYKRLEKLVEKDTVDPIIAVLEKTFSEQESSVEFGTTSCHNPAHIVGEIAYEKGMNFSDLLDVCSERCGFGCLHGGFIARFKESSQDFLTGYKDICSNLEEPTDRNIRSCWHIVGHGLNEFYRDDLEATNEKCMELPTEKARWHCFSGVRMEYLVGSPGNPSRIEYSAQNLLNFCEQFPVEFQDECYAEAPFYALKVAGDVDTSIEICKGLNLDRITRMKCASGAGAEYVTIYKNDPDSVYNYCLRHGEYFNDCVWGALQVFSSEWDYLRNGARLCEIVNTGFRDQCFSYFGEGLEWWYDKEFRENICGELSEPEKNQCLTDPIDKRDYLKAPR